MKKPIIFAVDDDPQVLRAVVRDLKSKYRKEFRIISTESANEALQTIIELKKKGEEIALFLSDQRMPEMLGVDYLEKAKPTYPEAKRILLTAYSDTDAAIKAINDVQLDYYLMKPWDPPEEKLFPIIDDQLEEWEINYRPDFLGVKVIGYQYSPKSHKIKDFLSGNLFPFQWLDVELNPKAKELLDLNEVELKELPVLISEGGEVLKDPTLAEIGEKIGLTTNASSELYDVVIIGAGPAGLAAAVYGGSEGLNTLLIEKRAPGGQAGTSSRIENYLGFPKGLSGADLSRRAVAQATRFGVEFLSPQEVNTIDVQDNYKIIQLVNGKKINTKSIIITTGVEYRKLPAEGIENFTGAGVYYGAASTEAASTQDKEVYIVGGGNSAGQAAVYLSKFAKNVYILVRRENLNDTMSSYLIDQIDGIENIHLKGKTIIKKAEGEDRLTHLIIADVDGENERKVEAGGLFIFIGAKPFTEWLDKNVLKDNKGYIVTGRELVNFTEYKKIWKQDRNPYLLETCTPGIFAAGDVRSGAMKRVASAVGEGAMAISFVHQYLGEV
ncbi:response regulator [Flexithrix dorotheae]|uniref:response regulator n=1 Tax=Flexithrix dorotheae TaxID=70993 RepID=UPI00037BDB74|nr:response regulator [Flexithrix dorotheae]